MAKHIHKYHRIHLAKMTVWACALDECTHYMPPDIEETIKGKKTICWGINTNPECEQFTIMDNRTMQLDKPLCYKCDKPDPEVIKKLKNMGVMFDRIKLTGE